MKTLFILISLVLSLAHGAGAGAVHLPAGAACASARGAGPSGAFSGAGCSPWAIPVGAAGHAGPGPMAGHGACGAGRLYLRRARVLAVDSGAGLVTVIDGAGEAWSYYGAALPSGAGVALVMHTNGTETIYDDAIIAAILTAE